VRRRAAIDELYTDDCVLYVPPGTFVGVRPSTNSLAISVRPRRPHCERLRRHAGRTKVRVGRTEIASEFVEGLTPDKRAGRHIQHTVIGIELVNRARRRTASPSPKTS